MEISRPNSHETPFKVYIFASNENIDASTVIFTISTLIGDEFSCTYLAHEIINLFDLALNDLKNGIDEMSTSLKSYSSIEKEFGYFTFAESSKKQIERNPTAVSQAIAMLKEQILVKVKTGIIIFIQFFF